MPTALHVKQFLLRFCRPRKTAFVMLVETRFLGREHGMLSRERS
jgi:hypothetical protein